MDSDWLKLESGTILQIHQAIRGSGDVIYRSTRRTEVSAKVWSEKADGLS